MEKFSYLKSTNAEYIDEMLTRYNQDPDSVDASWRYFFEGMELGTDLAPEEDHGNGALAAGTPAAVAAPGGVDLSSEAKVAELIMAYRELGRLVSDLDPLTPPQS